MIVVAGGGLAGAASAILLAEAGRAVTLIERETGPANKICGEFLSGEAQRYLHQLGFDIASLGGHQITNVRLIRGARSVTTALPFAGLGLTRRTLDEALLGRAAAAGVIIQRGHAIRRLTFDDAINIEIDQCETLRTQTLLLATGKHDLRGMTRHARPSRFVGFKTYFHLAAVPLAELANHVELIQFRGGYAGLQRVEDGLANLSLLIDTTTLKRLGGKFPDVLAHITAESPHLAARLADGVDILPTPLTIARVPYGFMHQPRPSDPPGLYRLGDQAAVIQSFTGDGMAIALHSAALATLHIAGGRSAQTYHEHLRASTFWQIKRAGALHATATAPLLGQAFFAGARLWPSALAAAAAWTRIPEAAMAQRF
jgi:flavin-dependent dehydrogenase